MTGKLIKFELRSSMRLMLAVWAALIAASLLFSLSINLLGDKIQADSYGANAIISIIEVVTGTMYFATFVSMVVITIIIIILRFYKGLLGDEGYLMHTLPVKPWQLITAKGITATIVVLLGVIIALLSFMILAGLSGANGITELMKDIFDVCKMEPRVILIAVEMFFLLIMSILKSIYQVYASLAIGQLANKYRLLISLAAYIGINIVLSVILMIIMMVAGLTGLGEWLGNMLVDMGDDPFNIGHAFMGVLFLGTVLQLAVFHIITERIMSLKLNLQ